MTLRIGLQLPVQAQSSIFVESWEADAGPAELRAVAVAADRSGWDHVAVCEHVTIPSGRVDRVGATWYEPMSTLAWLAAATSSVRLVTHVYVLPLHHPLVTAKQVATVDTLSGGRLVLGVGTGHVEEEFAALGSDVATRGRRTDEHLDALRAALAPGPTSFRGPTVAWEDMVLGPQPVQDPVPIWIGGSSPAALRRVGERGDGWLPQGTQLADMPAAVATIREAAERAGRDPDTIAIGGLPLPMYLGTPSWEVGPWTRTGSVDELRAHLDEWAAVGCDHVQVRFRSRSVGELVDQIETFGPS